MKPDQHIISEDRKELLSRFDILRTEYSKVMNDKDVLINWGKPQLEALYATRIGVYQIELLKRQLEVKALQRKIELVRSLLAKEMPIDVDQINMTIEAELLEAQLNIMNQVALVEKGKALLAHLDSPTRSMELRNIFRELSKQLHPDINPDLTPEQSQIWHKVKDAYKAGDLERLKAFKIIYETELTGLENHINELTNNDIVLRNEVLTEGIKLIQSEIEEIRVNFPFSIEKQIKDSEWVSAEVKEIDKRIILLKDREANLKEELLQLLNNYNGTEPQLN